MNWELLLIPLIALGVWILSHIFRGAEDQRQQERARAIEENTAKRVPPRRPMTDLDRFLAEAKQRRKPEGAEEKKPPPPPPTHLPIERARKKAPRTERPAERPPPKRLTTPVEPKPVSLPLALPEERLPNRPLPMPSPKVKEPPLPVAVPVPVAMLDEPIVVPVTTRDLRRRPVLVLLEKMLRDRTSLQAALLLQEILGPPKARRG